MNTTRTTYNIIDSLAGSRQPEPESDPEDLDSTIASGGENEAIEAAMVNQKKTKNTRSMRRAKRRALLASEGVQKTGVKTTAQRHVLDMLRSDSLTYTPVSRMDLKTAEGGWLGSRKQPPMRPEYTLSQVVQNGLRLIQWDGCTPHALLDNAGFIIAVLVGRARGNFQQVLEHATAEFQLHSTKLATGEQPQGGFINSKQGRRGQFHAVIAGVSYGGGQPAPMQSAIPNIYSDAVTALQQSEAMSRLAGFQSRAFQAYFPKIYAYYEAELAKLWAAMPQLKRPYKPSVMPAVAYNLGPATVCRPHRDSANLSFGICSITALGHFSSKDGGHLVLEELGVVIEFPPGSTVLIPSAIITHANTKISEGEIRYSFTQYAAGALFCYIENGMKSETAIRAGLSLNSAERDKRKMERKARWANGARLFSRVSELTEANSI